MDFLPRKKQDRFQSCASRLVTVSTFANIHVRESNDVQIFVGVGAHHGRSHLIESNGCHFLLISMGIVHNRTLIMYCIFDAMVMSYASRHR